MIKFDLNTAIFTLVEYRKLKQTDLAQMLDISAAGVSKKKRDRTWSDKDVEVLRKELNADIMRLAMDIAAGTPPMVALKQQIDEQSPPEFSVSFSAEEIKSLILGQAKTLENTQRELDELKQKMSEILTRIKP